jgi:transcriptional regulator with XRE-family HTH domain
MENDNDQNQSKDFSKWLEQKYLEWRINKLSKKIDDGVSANKAGFCEYLNISKPTLARLLHHKAEPERQVLQALVLEYGEEVLEVLGKDIPPSDIKEVTTNWEKINLLTKGKIIELVREDLEKQTG